jgi:hypothetical protein
MNFLPDRIVPSVIGGHFKRLRQLVQEHGDQVELISAHDVYAFNRHSGRS